MLFMSIMNRMPSAAGKARARHQEEHHGDMPLVLVAFGILGRGHGRETSAS